jgi:hypothetical protein
VNQFRPAPPKLGVGDLLGPKTMRPVAREDRALERNTSPFHQKVREQFNREWMFNVKQKTRPQGRAGAYRAA